MSSDQEARRLPVVPFNDHLRIEVTEVGAGYARARIGDHHELTNHLGTVHAGALFSVAEAASGHAFMGTLYGAVGEKIATLATVVKEARINFLKPAKGSVEANATLETPIEDVVAALGKEGRATVTVKVSLTDSGGVEVATMHPEWHIRQRR